MSVASGRVALNNLTQGRCAPRSAKKKAKLAKRAAKLHARRENENVSRASTGLAACTMEDASTQDVITPVPVNSARELATSAAEGRESVNLSEEMGSVDQIDSLQPHLLAYCSGMSSSTVEMIKNTAAGDDDSAEMQDSSLRDGSFMADAASELGWHVVDTCPPLEEGDEEEEDVEEEGYLVVPSS